MEPKTDMQKFAILMEEILSMNDWKTNYHEWSIPELIDKAAEQLHKLRIMVNPNVIMARTVEIGRNAVLNEIMAQSAEVANCMMFIAKKAEDQKTDED